MRRSIVAGRLSQIGNEWQSRLKRFFDSPLTSDAKPLEIRQAVLDDIEHNVEPVGRGRKVFPYNRILVRVAQANAGPHALDAAFRDLDARVRERLAELHCAAPGGLEVRIAILKQAPEEWTDGQLFSVEYDNQAEVTPERRDTPRPVSVRITIVKGAAGQQEFTFNAPMISIGRTAEPTDEMGRVRRNDVVFLDTVDGATETVGRAHARLKLDAGTGEYLLFDEGSSNGTSIVRGGTTIYVSAHDPRGVRVRSDDEIQLGRAVIRVSIDAG
jgi:hypothetical protein